MSCLIKLFLRDTAGATAIEYALIAVAIGVSLAAVVWQIGGSLAELYNGVGAAVGG